jgi:NAD(P)-dependent dehydrogenase (short-subunit alcohol dehydrogenase family)
VVEVLGLRRTALVTGANGDLGRATCARLAELGCQVVAGARQETAAKEVASALGGNASWVVLDVTNEESVREAKKRVGDVDILVNNAGVLLDLRRYPMSVPLGLVEQELQVNTLGVWRVCQYFMPGMMRRGWGRVVNVSSGTASFSRGLFLETPGYAVSKVALNAVTVLLAEETRGSGVLVNAVNPGLVRTRMRPDAQRLPEEAARYVARGAMLPDDGPSGEFLRGHATMGW